MTQTKIEVGRIWCYATSRGGGLLRRGRSPCTSAPTRMSALLCAAPRACANFAELCGGFVNKQGVELRYAGTSFHRYVPGFCLQGGDVNGRGGDSIYGGMFKDEKPGLKLPHSFGTVSMANSGPNTNRSQFFFCLSREAANPTIDGKHVVVGSVVNDEGLEFLRRMDNEVGLAAAGAGGQDGESPGQDVFVLNAGIS